MKKEPHLKFTDQELAENTPVGNAARKAKKAAERADKADAKIPRRKKPKVALHFDDEVKRPKEVKAPREKARGRKKQDAEKAVQKPAQKPSTKSVKFTLCFEEQQKPPAKSSIRARDAPRRIAHSMIQNGVQSQDENTDVSTDMVQAADTAEQRTEAAFHDIHRTVQLRPYRGAEKAEWKLEKANLGYLQKKAHAEQPTSNPISKWQQKRQIKRQYAAAKAGYSGKTVKHTAKGAEKAVKNTEKAAKFVSASKKPLLVVLAIALLLMFFLNVVSSCSVIVEGVGSVLAGSTYPASDSALLNAEAAYTAKEEELQRYLDNYTGTHDYDEYHFDLDEISHDPYVLLSLLSAMNPGDWTASEITRMVEDLFDRQYILTEFVETETRYRTETRTDYEYVYNPDTGSYEWRSYTHTVQVPYEYRICTVTLENRDLSHLPVELLSGSQLNMYATYMATLGNRPELFPDSPYVDLYLNKTDQSFDIPADAIPSDQVATMLREAQKYLGYPYVWGGSSPETSFDCSGYVCWVVNHSGWNIGRLSAQGICNVCAPISAANAQPGDLVFFKGTYDTPGVSHCGIYVGNNTMIHCGDPIKYANLNTNYWQSHFYCFGRLP
jgi:hypothetical protein